MGYLEQATKPTPQAPIITIVGFPGAGKTTLAAMFDKPIFVQAENASTVFETWPQDRQPAFLPVIPSADKKRNIKPSEILADQIRELCTAKHPFRTVVVDTVTAINTLFEGEVVAFDGNPETQDIGNAAGGFHKGFLVTAGMHARVLMMVEHLRRKGITVIFLAHSGVIKLKNRPDTASEYTAFAVDMHEKSRALYVAKSDCVLYLKSRDVVMGHDSNKKGQTTKFGRIKKSADRVLICSADGTVGYVDAKNRYGMPEELPCPHMNNPIAAYIPYLNGGTAGPEIIEDAEEIEENNQ